MQKCVRSPGHLPWNACTLEQPRWLGMRVVLHQGGACVGSIGMVCWLVFGRLRCVEETRHPRGWYGHYLDITTAASLIRIMLVALVMRWQRE